MRRGETVGLIIKGRNFSVTGTGRALADAVATSIRHGSHVSMKTLEEGELCRLGGTGRLLGLLCAMPWW